MNPHFEHSSENFQGKDSDELYPIYEEVVVFEGGEESGDWESRRDFDHDHFIQEEI